MLAKRCRPRRSVFLKSYALSKVEDLLAEYKQAAKGKLIIEKTTRNRIPMRKIRARLDGITGAQMPSGDMFYLGIAVNLLDSKEAIPLCQPTGERLLEYDLTRAISRVVTPEKPVVGVMSALPVFGMAAEIR